MALEANNRLFFLEETARKTDDSKHVCHDNIAQSPPLDARHATQMIGFVNPTR